MPESRGGIDNGCRRLLETSDELGHRHAGDEVGPLDGLFTPVVPDNDAVDAAPGPIDPNHLGLHQDSPGTALDLALDRIPHHPGPVAGVIELFDERLDGCLRLQEHAQESGSQGQILDALGGPLRFQLGAGDTPDLFGVGFEEGLEQPFPEAVRHPLLERVFAAVREQLPLQITENDKQTFPQPKPLQGVQRAQWIKEKFPIVVYPRQTRAAEEVLPKHLLPHLFHLFHLGEKAMASHVEIIATILGRAREPAD